MILKVLVGFHQNPNSLSFKTIQIKYLDFTHSNLTIQIVVLKIGLGIKPFLPQVPSLTRFSPNLGNFTRPNQCLAPVPIFKTIIQMHHWVIKIQNARNKFVSQIMELGPKSNYIIASPLQEYLLWANFTSSLNFYRPKKKKVECQK